MKLHIPLSDGTTVTLEGEYEELVQAAEKFVENRGVQVAVRPSSPQQSAVANASKPQSRRWTEQTAKRLWSMLYGDQAKLVKFLVERGGTTSYAELGKHMGFNAQRLSGVLSPITRNAQTATGDRLARLVDWRANIKGVREYYIDAEALPLFQQLVKQP